jgi:ketosteroid isomerase-like protein
MRLRALVVFATALAVTGFACEKAPTVDVAAEEQAIRDAVTRFNENLVAKNDSALAAAYAADAVLLPPNEAPVTGPSAIGQYWAQMWPMNASLVITPTSVKVAQSGDLATESGTWTLSATAPTGPISDNGKYLVAWTKVSGEWKIAHDMWSSNNPAPGTAPADSTAAK